MKRTLTGVLAGTTIAAAVLFLAALPANAAEEITVSAAVSLRGAFTDIGKTFEAANPGAKVVFNFGASGALLQQMAQGAPVDVFASADQKTMDQAAEKNLVTAGTRKNFAGNSLVLVVPAQSKAAVKGIRDLEKKDIARIAVGNPETVPAGRYTKAALTAAGKWDALSPRFILAENVRQVLDYVARGEVDAGFVYKTDAALAKDKARVAADILGEPVLYPVAVCAGAANKALAEKFAAFLLEKGARDILAGYGFVLP
jgi:molybdate transport system substrate-binding protein